MRAGAPSPVQSRALNLQELCINRLYLPFAVSTVANAARAAQVDFNYSLDRAISI